MSTKKHSFHALTSRLKQLNMSICDVCRSVSFTALAAPRAGDFTVTRVADQYEMLQIWCEPTADDISVKQSSDSVPPRSRYHKSMEALRISAESCPLCALVQVGVQTWIDCWNNAAKNNKVFIEFHMDKDPIPSTEQLWLTQCHNEAKGFYVWVEQPRDLQSKKLRLNLLTAVGFSVDDGS